MANVTSLMLRLFVVLSMLGLGSFATAQAGLEPPKVEILDKNKINMATGSLSHSLTDVAIGSDDLKLSHTITNSNYNDFVGYRENYRGIVYKKRLFRFPGDDYSNGFDVMRVNSGDETTDFEIVNGKYVGLKNRQSTLVVGNNDTYIFTKPDGTVVTFARFGTEIDSNGGMREIKYPNGFTITIHGKSVNTNNGLQLKHIFIDNNSDADSLKWSRGMPKHIVAINNTVEYCDPDATTCELMNSWPTVTYDWPNGMPKVMYKKPTVFKVTDAIGRVTEFHQKLFDINEGGSGPTGVKFVPRIVKVKEATSNGTTIEYDYKNRVEWVQNTYNSAYKTVVETAVLYKAWANGQEWNYSLSNKTSDIGRIINYKSSSGFNAIKKVKSDLRYGLPTVVTTQNKTIALDASYANTVKYIHYPEGNSTHFEYDDRKRLIKRTEKTRSGSNLAEIVMEAGYAPGCTNPKTCNKPNWVSDGRGKRTDYTYHPQSGQVATITLPADQNGVRPQTRYTYEQKYAWYLNGSGSYQRADTPIWLKTKESFCRTSPASENGCTASNDEVVTEYDYGPDEEPNNLFLRGVAVTADGGTRRTCYSYDIYGNRIGETMPKAGLTSCP